MGPQKLEDILKSRRHLTVSGRYRELRRFGIYPKSLPVAESSLTKYRHVGLLKDGLEYISHMPRAKSLVIVATFELLRTDEKNTALYRYELPIINPRLKAANIYPI